MFLRFGNLFLFMTRKCTLKVTLWREIISEEISDGSTSARFQVQTRGSISLTYLKQRLCTAGRNRFVSCANSEKMPARDLCQSICGSLFPHQTRQNFVATFTQFEPKKFCFRSRSPDAAGSTTLIWGDAAGFSGVCGSE